MGSFQLGDWSGCRRLGSPQGFAPGLWLTGVICKHIYLESIGNQLTEVRKEKGVGGGNDPTSLLRKMLWDLCYWQKKKKIRIIEAR